MADQPNMGEEENNSKNTVYFRTPKKSRYEQIDGKVKNFFPKFH